MKRKSFSPGALTAPLPPVLVTVGDEENANILTIAWTGILSTIPPRTYVSVRPRRHSYTILKEKREFVINLPTAEMAREVDYCGIYTGAKVDKFKECGFTAVKSEQVSAPTIEECPLALECRVVEIIPMGTHDVFVSDIVGVSCREDILDESGKIRFDRANLLAYAHGEYYALGERLGVFGFSTDKKGAKGKGSAQRKVNATTKSGNGKATTHERVPHRDSKNSGAIRASRPTSKQYTSKIGDKSPTSKDNVQESAHRAESQGAKHFSTLERKSDRPKKQKGKVSKRK